MESKKTNIIKLLAILREENTYPVLDTAIDQVNEKERLTQRGTGALLKLLSEHNNLTNAEIAEYLDIKPSSVTASSRQLETRCFVVRKTDRKDKRVSRISLTDKGRDHIARSGKIKPEYVEAIFKRFEEDDVVELNTLLTRLIDNVDTADEEILEEARQDEHTQNTQSSKSNQRATVDLDNISKELLSAHGLFSSEAQRLTQELEEQLRRQIGGRKQRI